MACEVFKIVNKLSPEYIQDMISIKTSTYNFRGERNADIPRVNTKKWSEVIQVRGSPDLEQSNLQLAGGRILPAVPRTAPEMGWPWMWLPSVLCLVLFFALCF